MNDDQQTPILVGLAALAVLGGVGWAYVLATQPEPEVLPPEPIPVRRITCEAPTDGLQADAHLRDLEVTAGKLRATVHRTDGSSLWRDREGIARLVVRWRGAAPGKQVDCTTGDPVRSMIQGRIDGLADATMISACTDGLTLVTEGRFEVDTIVDHPCSYWFMDASGEIVGKVEATAHADAPLVLAVR